MSGVRVTMPDGADLMVEEGAEFSFLDAYEGFAVRMPSEPGKVRLYLPPDGRMILGSVVVSEVAE